jgi:uncharacterized protein
VEWERTQPPLDSRRGPHALSHQERRALGEHERLGSDNEAFRSLTTVAKGMPPNLRNEKGDSLVMLAGYHRHVDAVPQRIIFSWAAPRSSEQSRAGPKCRGGTQGYRDVAEALLDKGANIEVSTLGGNTAMMSLMRNSASGCPS